MRDGATRVMIVDDSATARAALCAALGAALDIEVVGEVADGEGARRGIQTFAPDLITMDLFLRAESGLDVALSIMESTPRPIVVVTAADPHDPAIIFRAMQVGVLEVLGKLPGPTHPDYEARRRELERTVRTLAGVPVVRRRPGGSSRPVPAPAAEDARGSRQMHAAVDSSVPPSRSLSSAPPQTRPAELLLVGASTGGPPLLASLLRDLMRPFPLPILLVQHIAAGFLRGFVAWLGQTAGVPARTVRSREKLEPGCVYVPDEDHHLVVAGAGEVALCRSGPRAYLRPAIDVLFESVAGGGWAPGSIAVLLTGMGRDGAEGMRALRDGGAYTIAQSPKTSAVASMPEHAIASGGVCEVVDARDLARTIDARVAPSPAARHPL